MVNESSVLGGGVGEPRQEIGILAQAGLNERTRQLTCAMTLNRLIHPASELAMPDWIRSTALADILQVDFQDLAEDALYRNLDKLHQQRVTIEAALAEREKTLFSLDQTVFLYDVTSTFFEGLALANPKAKRGYSRDHRSDCKQVLIGLAVNRDGFPLAHEVFAGNRHDSTTLEEMLTALDKRIGLHPGQTVVVDRGMSGEENLSKIVAKKLHYLVAAPLRSARRLGGGVRERRRLRRGEARTLAEQPVSA